MYRDSGQFIFHNVSLFKDIDLLVEMGTILQENQLRC